MDQDTTPKQQDEYFRRLRKLSAVERAGLVDFLTRSVREGALMGIRNRHPGISEEQAQVRLFVRLYGRAAALKLFAQVPDDAQ